MLIFWRSLQDSFELSKQCIIWRVSISETPAPAATAVHVENIYGADDKRAIDQLSFHFPSRLDVDWLMLD